mmetsp:Transcript_27038/g.83291  ORF Transcript_27038/g.83291 Transcript_27038/m.83291 type:complete len:261 (+) Transcript_27038:1493-2275(+)
MRRAQARLAVGAHHEVLLADLRARVLAFEVDLERLQTRPFKHHDPLAEEDPVVVVGRIQRIVVVGVVRRVRVRAGRRVGVVVGRLVRRFVVEVGHAVLVLVPLPARRRRGRTRCRRRAAVALVEAPHLSSQEPVALRIQRMRPRRRGRRDGGRLAGGLRLFGRDDRLLVVLFKLRDLLSASGLVVRPFHDGLAHRRQSNLGVLVQHRHSLRSLLGDDRRGGAGGPRRRGAVRFEQLRPGVQVAHQALFRNRRDVGQEPES